MKKVLHASPKLIFSLPRILNQLNELCWKNLNHLGRGVWLSVFDFLFGARLIRGHPSCLLRFLVPPSCAANAINPTGYNSIKIRPPLKNQCNAVIRHCSHCFAIPGLITHFKIRPKRKFRASDGKSLANIGRYFAAYLVYFEIRTRTVVMACWARQNKQFEYKRISIFVRRRRCRLNFHSEISLACGSINANYLSAKPTLLNGGSSVCLG